MSEPPDFLGKADIEVELEELHQMLRDTYDRQIDALLSLLELQVGRGVPFADAMKSVRGEVDAMRKSREEKVL